LILVYTAFNLPFCIWNMRAAFQAVPKELEEAAFLDGATAFQTFIMVTIPNALPAIGVASLVAFLVGYSEFAIGWLFIEKSSNATLAMALWGVLTLGSVPWSQLAALALMMSVPVVIIFLILQRAIFERLTFGEMKS
jgi:ABC-type glycerol-3-phosphate transport system permease component